MTLRHLVPALGLAALTATSGFAADAMPTVSFSGWSDNILSYSNSDDNDPNPDNDPTTAKDDGAGSLRFSSAAALKAKWKIADRVDGKINVWFYPGASNSDAAAGDVNNNLNVREMFLTVDLTNGFSLQMGKAIDHVGWLSADPTGLYTVNASMIGYTGIYGNDVIGAAIIFNDTMRSPISAQFHLTNGYFTNIDSISPGYVASVSDQRENTDLGIGLGLTYTLPEKMGNIDFDLAYDMHSEQNGTGPADLGGDVLMVGLNATIIPTTGLMIGAEVMYFSVDDSEGPTGVKGLDGFSRIQGMLLANYALPGAPANMSITGMLQYITVEDDTMAPNTDAETSLGFALALMTNPFGGTNFGANAEIGYYKVDNVNYNTTAIAGNPSEEKGFALSFELIGSF